MDKMLLRLARAAPIDSSARSYLCQLARSISLADRPVADAERVLRRALVAPNEQKSDLDAIAACSRLKAWLRKDHIDRRYRGSDRYMRAATALREADPRVPPSLAELKKLFGLGKWAFDATDDSLESAPRDDALAKLEALVVDGGPRLRGAARGRRLRGFRTVRGQRLHGKPRDLRLLYVRLRRRPRGPPRRDET